MESRSAVSGLGIAIAALVSVATLRAGPTGVSVSNVDDLYKAVNDPAKAGVQITLEPGYYPLSPVDATLAPRPNGGQLRLQHDMSLSGHPGHADAVVIDAALIVAPGPLVQIGNGTTAVEWLTIENAVNLQSTIDTGETSGPVGSGPVAHVRLAHLVIRNGQRGFDIRNKLAGSLLQVDLDSNELAFNQTMFGQGIRFVNLVDGAVIQASLHGNTMHDNYAGLLATNLNCTGSSVAIDSNDDHLDGNLVGAILFGGNSNLPTAVANGNLVTFDAHAGSVVGNAGVNPNNGASGGLYLEGADSMAAGHASNNTLRVGVWGMKLSGNPSGDVVAYGAHTLAAAPAGTYNTLVATLNGVSKQADVVAPVDSVPAEPAGTNTATIIR